MVLNNWVLVWVTNFSRKGVMKKSNNKHKQNTVMSTNTRALILLQEQLAKWWIKVKGKPLQTNFIVQSREKINEKFLNKGAVPLPLNLFQDPENQISKSLLYSYIKRAASKSRQGGRKTNLYELSMISHNVSSFQHPRKDQK